VEGCILKKIFQAITMNGTKVLLGLQPGTKEDTACCSNFLRDLKARELADPVFVVTDGTLGLIRAVEECLPRALRHAAWRTE